MCHSLLTITITPSSPTTCPSFPVCSRHTLYEHTHIFIDRPRSWLEIALHMTIMSLMRTRARRLNGRKLIKGYLLVLACLNIPTSKGARPWRGHLVSPKVVLARLFFFFLYILISIFLYFLLLYAGIKTFLSSTWVDM